MLARKLIESLVISVMQKRFGATHPDYFINENGRFKFISVILRNFCREFDKELKQFSSLTDRKSLARVRNLIDSLIAGFNVSVHQLSAYTTVAALDTKQEDLSYVLDFLKYLDEHVALRRQNRSTDSLSHPLQFRSLRFRKLLPLSRSCFTQ